MKPTAVSADALFEEFRATLRWEWIAGLGASERRFDELVVSAARSGADLVGYLNYIHPYRVQILGEREVKYLTNATTEDCARRISRIVTLEPPVLILADGQVAPDMLLSICERAQIPMFATRESAAFVIDVLRAYLSKHFADRITMHGVFMDILGLGVMITGESGLGKSELGLELISRGNGLVADDAVDLYRINQTTIEGKCPELLQNLLEVRGIGLLDIRAIFGETAVRRKMRLKLIVHLVRRETLEEAGISTGPVTYHASQPWPFPHSLMIGCYAEALSENIALDHSEIESGRWFSRSEVLEMLDGVHPEGWRLPPVNFVWLDDRQRVWITVMFCSHADPGPTRFRADRGDGCLILVDAVDQPTSARVVAQGLFTPNECRVALDGASLLVNETFSHRVVRYVLREDGSLGTRDVLAQFDDATLPDGLSLDVEGGLWVTAVASNRILLVMPDGRWHQVVEDQDPDHLRRVVAAVQNGTLDRELLYQNPSRVLPNVTSIAFGGPDLHTAYVGSVSGNQIASFQSPVAGVPPTHWDW